MDEQLKQSALDFHEFPVPGKIQVSPTKPLPPNAIWRWLTRRRGGALPEIEKIRWQPTNTPRAATLSRSFPTVQRCWG